MSIRTILGTAAVVAVLAAPVQAAPVLFYGVDSGVGPGGARPNADAAAADFDAAAALLGTVSVIDMESLAVGYSVNFSLDSSVTGTFSGTESGSDAGITGVGGNATLGYNTTAGGSNYLRVVPLINIGTSALTLTFASPIEAFGAYFTGLGTAAGDLFAVFNDGTVQEIAISGMPAGGVLFFGFTSAGANITSLSLELRGVSSTRDVYGIDDIRYVTSGSVPEPFTATLIGLALVAGIARRRMSLRA